MLTLSMVVPAEDVTFRDHVYGFLRRRKRAPPHVHRCPECYDVEACGMDCTIEPDLALDNGTPCASHMVCSACERYAAVRIAGNAEILGRWADDGGPVPEPDPLARLIERGDAARPFAATPCPCDASAPRGLTDALPPGDARACGLPSATAQAFPMSTGPCVACLGAGKILHGSPTSALDACETCGGTGSAGTRLIAGAWRTCARGHEWRPEEPRRVRTTT